MAAPSITCRSCTSTEDRRPLAGPCRFVRPRPLAESVMTLYMKEQKATDEKMLLPKPKNIPEELKSRPQWVVWKAVGEKPDKIPYSARTGRKASSTDLMTWSTFPEALEAYEHGEYGGLGFVFCS